MKQGNIGKPNHFGKPTSIKFRPEDEKIIVALQKKLGVADVSNVVRQALRALAAKEGVPL
jgi:hypothetical protein